MGITCPHRDADKGSCEIDTCLSRHPSLICELVEALLGQDDNVGALTAAQAVEQRQRRREIGVDPRAAFRFIACREIANGTLQGKRREHANDVHGN